MRKKFNIEAERNYYEKNELPQESFIVKNNVVENIMRFCTKSYEWDSLLHGKIVLEVGAGECPYASYTFSKASPKLYIASDLFTDRMLFARASLTFPHIAFLGSNVLSLPLKNGSVDFCMAQGLLHHIPNLKEAIREIGRVLKIGGMFLFREPWGGNPLIWIKYNVIEKSDNEFPLTQRQMKDCLAANGFKVLQMNRFWLRFPKLSPGPWSVNIGGLAIKER
ncbi:MAG: class I SAM-dependent methyltransferase [Desulfobaccales bacterium]